MAQPVNRSLETLDGVDVAVSSASTVIWEALQNRCCQLTIFQLELLAMSVFLSLLLL